MRSKDISFDHIFKVVQTLFKTALDASLYRWIAHWTIAFRTFHTKSEFTTN